MDDQDLPEASPISPAVREQIITYYLEDPRRRESMARMLVTTGRVFLTDPSRYNGAALVDLGLRLQARLDETDTLDRVALLSTLGDVRALQDKITKGV